MQHSAIPTLFPSLTSHRHKFTLPMWKHCLWNLLFHLVDSVCHLVSRWFTSTQISNCVWFQIYTCSFVFLWCFHDSGFNFFKGLMPWEGVGHIRGQAYSHCPWKMMGPWWFNKFHSCPITMVQWEGLVVYLNWKLSNFL